MFGITNIFGRISASILNKLGVYLDQPVTFQEHTSKLIRKITTQLGLLKRIRGDLTAQAAEIVDKSMILPKLEWCDFIRNQLSPSRYSALEHLQITAARIVLMKGDGHEELINQLGITRYLGQDGGRVFYFIQNGVAFLLEIEWEVF